MSQAFPSGFRAVRAKTYNANTSASQSSTIVYGHASANTKGSWYEMTPSLDFDCEGFFLTWFAWNASYTEYAIDVGVGAAASEQVVASNIMAWNHASAGHSSGHYIPVGIKAGSRIAVRLQASTGSSPAGHCMITPISGSNGGIGGYSICEAYGFNAAATRGTELASNTVSVNTKSAYTELTSGTTRDHKHFRFRIRQYAGGGDGTCLVDIATGAAASETNILENLNIYSSTVACVYEVPIDLALPAGTRLSFRYQSSRSNASNLLTVLAHGYS